MAYSQILFEVEDRVATITLNRPEQMNTWTSVMSGELSQAMHRCNEDDEIRAVVLTGAGDRAFCAGADLGRGDETFAGRENREPEPDVAQLLKSRGEELIVTGTCNASGSPSPSNSPVVIPSRWSCRKTP